MSDGSPEEYFYRDHALNRLAERTHISPNEVVALFQEGKFVPIGTDAHKEHDLFFSRKDNYFFVAIIDTKTREIITFLPVDFHNDVIWCISHEACAEAKRLALDEPPNVKPSAIALAPTSDMKSEKQSVPWLPNIFDDSITPLEFTETDIPDAGRIEFLFDTTSGKHVLILQIEISNSDISGLNSIDVLYLVFARFPVLQYIAGQLDQHGLTWDHCQQIRARVSSSSLNGYKMILVAQRKKKRLTLEKRFCS